LDNNGCGGWVSGRAVFLCWRLATLPTFSIEIVFPATNPLKLVVRPLRRLSMRNSGFAAVPVLSAVIVVAKNIGANPKASAGDAFVLEVAPLVVML
jgi:hypothetical protein